MGDAHVVQREGGGVGAVVEQPLDSFLVLVHAVVSEVGAAGQDVEDLQRETEKQYGQMVEQVVGSNPAQSESVIMSLGKTLYPQCFV